MKLKSSRWQYQSPITLLLMSVVVCLAVPTIAYASNMPKVGASAVTSSLTSDVPPPGSPQALLDTITDIGEIQYSQVFAGDALDTDGEIVVYAKTTSPSEAAFAAAMPTITALTSGAPSYVVVPVAHSYSDLEDLTMTIAAAEPTLVAEGIAMSGWGPDTSSNNVVWITLNNYNSGSAALLESTYGSNWVEVAPNDQPAMFKDNRNNDLAPFSGGDSIAFYYSLQDCSSGLSLVNSEGTTYATSAGHCSENPGEPVTMTQNTETFVGNVYNNYYAPNSYDFLTIDNTHQVGYVWGNGATRYNVIGSAGPDSPGDKVTFDGAYSGEVRGAVIGDSKHINYCQPYTDGYTTCHVTQASSSSTICLDGDSGGPVYNHNSTSNQVLGQGTIVGSNQAGTICEFQMLSYIFSATGLSLLTST